ncbi:hypothetical protein ACJJTC_019248, partial [Scirpophaga incertulas]
AERLVSIEGKLGIDLRKHKESSATSQVNPKMRMRVGEDGPKPTSDALVVQRSEGIRERASLLFDTHARDKSSGLDILNLSPAAHELTEQYQGSDRPAVIYPIASGLDILNLSPAAHELTEQYQGSDRPAVIYPIASGLDILNLSPAAHELTEQYQGSDRPAVL